MAKTTTRIPVAAEIDGKIKTVMVSQSLIDGTIDTMRDECRRKIELEIEHHEAIINALKARLSEVPDMEIRQVVSLNASLSHHNPKVKR